MSSRLKEFVGMRQNSLKRKKKKGMIICSFNRKLKTLIYVPLISSQLYKVSLLVEGISVYSGWHILFCSFRAFFEWQILFCSFGDFLEIFWFRNWFEGRLFFFSSVCSDNFEMDESYLSYGQNEWINALEDLMATRMDEEDAWYNWSLNWTNLLVWRILGKS